MVVLTGSGVSVLAEGPPLGCAVAGLSDGCAVGTAVGASVADDLVDLMAAVAAVLVVVATGFLSSETQMVMRQSSQSKSHLLGRSGLRSSGEMVSWGPGEHGVHQIRTVPL